MNSEITFSETLSNLINAHSKENESDTPDFILANYMMKCLEAFNEATNHRTKWYKTEETPND